MGDVMKVAMSGAAGRSIMAGRLAVGVLAALVVSAAVVWAGPSAAAAGESSNVVTLVAYTTPREAYEELIPHVPGF